MQASNKTGTSCRPPKRQPPPEASEWDDDPYEDWDEYWDDCSCSDCLDALDDMLDRPPIHLANPVLPLPPQLNAWERLDLPWPYGPADTWAATLVTPRGFAQEALVSGHRRAFAATNRANPR